jgi:hypothetical protein
VIRHQLAPLCFGGGVGGAMNGGGRRLGPRGALLLRIEEAREGGGAEGSGNVVVVRLAPPWRQASPLRLTRLALVGSNEREGVG